MLNIEASVLKSSSTTCQVLIPVGYLDLLVGSLGLSGGISDTSKTQSSSSSVFVSMSKIGGTIITTSPCREEVELGEAYFGLGFTAGRSTGSTRCEGMELKINMFFSHPYNIS